MKLFCDRCRLRSFSDEINPEFVDLDRPMSWVCPKCFGENSLTSADHSRLLDEINDMEKEYSKEHKMHRRSETIVERSAERKTVSTMTTLESPTSFSTESNIWDSGLNVIEVEMESSKIVIPFNLLSVCRALSSYVDGKEFSILVKSSIDLNKDGILVTLSEDYVIPKQTIGWSSVDYDEDISLYRRQGYTTIIHAHPGESDSFSYADAESINSHFDCSILFNSTNGFVDSTILFSPKAGVKFRVGSSKFEMNMPEFALDEKLLKDKIKIKTFSNTTFNDYGAYGTTNYNYCG